MFTTSQTYANGVNATAPVTLLVKSGTIRVVFLHKGQETALPDITTSSLVDVKKIPFRVDVVGSATWDLINNG